MMELDFCRSVHFYFTYDRFLMRQGLSKLFEKAMIKSIEDV
jgi:hypothetical protein